MRQKNRRPHAAFFPARDFLHRTYPTGQAVRVKPLSSRIGADRWISREAELNMDEADEPVLDEAAIVGLGDDKRVDIEACGAGLMGLPADATASAYAALPPDYVRRQPCPMA